MYIHITFPKNAFDIPNVSQKPRRALKGDGSLQVDAVIFIDAGCGGSCSGS